MNAIPLIIMGVIVGLILIILLVAMTLKMKREGKSREINYRVFFVLGTTFLPLGIIYEIVFFLSGTKAFLVLGLSFIAIGTSYIAIGLGNRDKWRKDAE